MNEAYGFAMGVNILRPQLALIPLDPLMSALAIRFAADTPPTPRVWAQHTLILSSRRRCGSDRQTSLFPYPMSSGKADAGSPFPQRIVSYCTGTGVDVGMGVGSGLGGLGALGLQ